MSLGIHPSELGFLDKLAGSRSLSALAREIGISKAAVSKRLAGIEARIGIALVNRTTRRMSLTPEGDAVVERARLILAEMEELDQMLSQSQTVPRGLLRVNASLGFGRSHVAPLVSRFVRKYPQVDVQLELTATPPLLTDDAFDVCVRFGSPPDARMIARKLAAHQRLLCASPDYLKRHGTPQTPQDLINHNCIGIRQGSDAYGVWRLCSGHGTQRHEDAVRVKGNLATNDGEIAVRWALDGQGIIIRAEWDVAHLLASGQLCQVLPGWATPGADIHAVYPQRLNLSARVRTFVDFLAEAFTPAPGTPGELSHLVAQERLPTVLNNPLDSQ